MLIKLFGTAPVDPRHLFVTADSAVSDDQRNVLACPVAHTLSAGALPTLLCAYSVGTGFSVMAHVRAAIACTARKLRKARKLLT